MISKPLKTIKRRAVNIAASQLVTVSCFEQKPIPIIIQPNQNNLDLIAWATYHQEVINNYLQQQGAILFRGFSINKLAQFEELMTALFGSLLDYSYGSTPRHKIKGSIYTSTEYPPEQFIPLHNEMSYASNWPEKIGFFCLKAATKGGETPIANSRRIFQRIDPKIREKFQEKGILYVRNYSEQLDLPWQKVFQTTNKLQVENYCRQSGIEWEWNDNHLKTRQICQAVANHPQTNEMVWFNQAHLFHVSSLNSSFRDSLLEVLKEEDLPRNAYYGDGTPLEVSVLEEIRTIYQEEMVIFSWQSGDLLLLDNMLTAHGRMPFTGERRVVVAMAQPHDLVVKTWTTLI